MAKRNRPSGTAAGLNEISVARRAAIEGFEAARLSALAAGVAQTYTPGLATMTPCGGGDFETGAIDPNEWQGAFGSLPAPGSPNPFAGFTAGLVANTLTDADLSGMGTAHQSWVGPGVDPKVSISTTAPGSSGAVRIGNAVPRFGCELLSKTFTVTAAQRIIRFWYAVVLQNPDPASHALDKQPFFWVRVTDAAGAIVPGAVDLGMGSDMAISQDHPFFQTVKVDGEDVRYRDWTCAQINLSSQVGKQVTIEFVTGDCGHGGHWGYAYVDNFCGSCAGSPSGDFTFDAGASERCGKGNLCFDYTLPVAPTGAAGSIQIRLELLQNGATVATLDSPVLTSGTSHCFAIDPAAIPGLDPSLGGFDFAATGNFAFGATPLAPLTVGGAPDGMLPGLNNDYQFVCERFSYVVKFVCGTQAACDCACSPVLPGAYATEINIYNHSDTPAEIVKYVIPVVFAGAAAGREPGTVKARASDRITLEPYSATMDDCCRISELLLGAPAQGRAPLSIGFLEIVSPVALSVTAVYTASAAEGGPVSIDVQQIAARPRAAPPEPHGH